MPEGPAVGRRAGSGRRRDRSADQLRGTPRGGGGPAGTRGDRLDRVVQVGGDPTRVLAGTDCGFDTSAGRGRVAEDVVWAKLRAMSDGARIASERLGVRG